MSKKKERLKIKRTVQNKTTNIISNKMYLAGKNRTKDFIITIFYRWQWKLSIYILEQNLQKNSIWIWIHQVSTVQK